MPAFALIPKPPKFPPPARPAHVKKGPKKVTLIQPKLIFSTNPTDIELTTARVFLQPLVPMSTAPVPGENQALAIALLSFKSKTNPEDVSDLTGFLSSFPKSRWRPSLELNLGLRRFETGYLTDAMNYWKSAWNASKGDKGRLQRAVADESIGQLVLLEARLGRTEELQEYLSQLKRPVCATAEKNVHAAREGLLCQQKKPGIAYKCGPFALNSLLSVKAGKPVHSPLVFKIQSTKNGTNLAQLKGWTDQLGLKYQLAKRSRGAPILVPSVMHWKLGHFAAIVRKEGGRYRMNDATFGHAGNIALTAKAIDAETDGYFLVPLGALPKGWQVITTAEAQAVWGKGYADTRDPIGPCQEEQCMDSSGSCDCNGPLAKASANAAWATLHITDVPLSYTPPVGPQIDFRVNYDYLGAATAASAPYTNFGDTYWSFNWLSYLTVDVSNNVTVTTPHGIGSEFYAYPYQPNLYTQAQIVNVSSGVYQRQLPDGSVEVYNQADGSGRIFLTQVIDPQGNSATIQFDSTFRITSITDAIGQQTTITYVTNTLGAWGYYAIASITDPFSRSCSFSYTTALGSISLTSITDVVGLTSQFSYPTGTGGTPPFITCINRMTTPYGTTGFYVPVDNVLIFLFPDGTRSRIVSLILQDDCTAYWDREAMMMYPSDYVPGVSIDYSHCLFIRWALSGAGPDYVQVSVPYYVLPPLENRLYFYYPGGHTEASWPTEYFIMGTMNRPSSVFRTVSGTTTQTWQYTYNSNGNVTQSIDPIGRTFAYTYASNGIDLLEKDQTLSSTPDINGVWSSYSNHLPGSYKDGSGQVTSYTYNSYSELATRTDAASNVWTYSHDSNGYLTQIQGPLSGTSDVTNISYDGYGRVYQVTDSEGYAITYSYDAANRITQLTFPDGTSTQIIYDKLDPVLRKDRNGRWTQRSYDCMDRLSFEIDPLSRKTKYVWCACGSLSSLTDGNSNVTTWQHDLEGRVSQKTYPDQTTVAFSYDTVGRESSRVDTWGQTTNYSYNLDNTLSQVSYSNTVNPTSAVNYAYDPDYLRLVSVQNGWGTYSYSYNAYITSPSSTTTGAGKVSTVSNSVIANSNISYSYDVLGRVTNRSINGLSNSTTWGYDAISRITSENNPLGTFSYSYVDDVTGYSKGTTRLASISYPNGQVTNLNWFGNLRDQRLEGIINLKSDGTCLSQFAYSYDPAGEITAWQQQQGPNNNQIYSLCYDAAGQLISAKSGSEGTISPPYTNQNLYSYDSASNLIGAYKASMQLATVGGSPSVGDTLTITVFDPLLSGGQEPVSYTVQSGDDLNAIAANLGSAINSDSNLEALQIYGDVTGTEIAIVSASPNITTYSSSLSGGATETIVFGSPTNTMTNATAVGTATPGDVLTVSVHDPALSGGLESVSYTVQPGDNLGNIGQGLVSAINADSALSAIGVTSGLTEGSGQINSTSTNVTTYTQSVSTAATAGIQFSLNTNIINNGMIAGSPTAGDVLTVTTYDTALAGGSKSVSYTVASGDSLSDIATGLAGTISADTSLSAIMSAYTDGGSTLILESKSLNPTSYRATTSTGASETIVLGSNTNDGNTTAAFGGTQYQCNALNEVTTIGTGGLTRIEGTTNKAVRSGSVEDDSINIRQARTSPTTYGIPQYSSATETLTFGSPSFGNNSVFVGGTVTAGDVVSLIVFNTTLNGGQEQIFYTVNPGDSLNDVVNGLVAAINADSAIAGVGVTASNSSGTLILNQPGTSYTTSVSSGATEWLGMGFVTDGNTYVNVGGSITPGDILTITAQNSALPGGQESVNYTVQSGDSYVSIAEGFVAAINADTILAGIGITANNSAPAGLAWSQSLSASPGNSGWNTLIMSATDGGGNTSSTYAGLQQTSPLSQYVGFDFNGNLTNDGVNAYQYDAENRLIEIDYPGTGNSSQFTYDGLGQCVQIVENVGGTVYNTKQFIWCDNDRCETRDASSATVAQFFRYGQIIGGTSYFGCKNHLGSFTDYTGPSGVVAQYAYDPYGRVTKFSETVPMDFQYAEYYLHARSGLNLTVTRAYNSALARWMTRDPIMESGGTNLYCYTANAPTLFTDAFGLVRNVDFCSMVDAYDMFRYGKTDLSTDYFTVSIHGFAGNNGFGVGMRERFPNTPYNPLMSPEEFVNALPEGALKCKKCLVIYACRGARDVNGTSFCSEVAKLLGKCVICATGDITTHILGNTGVYGPEPGKTNTWVQYDANGDAAATSPDLNSLTKCH